jgi:hypothetical protein
LQDQALVHGVHSAQKPQILLDLPVLELDPLNIHLFFFDFPPANQKGAFHQIVKKSLEFTL